MAPLRCHAKIGGTTNVGSVVSSLAAAMTGEASPVGVTLRPAVTISWRAKRPMPAFRAFPKVEDVAPFGANPPRLAKRLVVGGATS
jgi:hypothetical protein